MFNMLYTYGFTMITCYETSENPFWITGLYFYSSLKSLTIRPNFTFNGSKIAAVKNKLKNVMNTVCVETKGWTKKLEYMYS